MTSQARLRFISRVLLAIGLITAVAIYILAPSSIGDPFGDPSKRYLHDLEVYGGRANVLQDEFRRWFDSLWHGKELAGTIAYISGFVFLVMRFIANPFRLNAPTTPGHQDSLHTTSASDRLMVPDSSPCQNPETSAPGEGRDDFV